MKALLFTALNLFFIYLQSKAHFQPGHQSDNYEIQNAYFPLFFIINPVLRFLPVP